MATLIVKTKSNNKKWTKYDRPRVGEVVIHKGNYYQNLTGINSEPQTTQTDNWAFISSLNPIKENLLNIASKKPGNTGPGIEVGDVVYGLLDDAQTFIPFGVYLGNVNGGEFQNIDNYSCNPLIF